MCVHVRVCVHVHTHTHVCVCVFLLQFLTINTVRRVKLQKKIIPNCCWRKKKRVPAEAVKASSAWQHAALNS